MTKPLFESQPEMHQRLLTEWAIAGLMARGYAEPDARFQVHQNMSQLVGFHRCSPLGERE